jgi:ATP-binding cassette, subfamily B, bacterial PglK
MEVAQKIVDLLSRRERMHLGLLFVAVLVMAFLEMISVASVLPFLSVAADPGKIQTDPWLSWTYDSLGFASTNGFLLALAGAALATLILSNVWIAATHWAEIRFTRGRHHGFSVRLLRRYLAQSYVFFLRRNSADLAKNILSEVNQAAGALMSTLAFTAKSLVALAIITLLVVFDPWVALFVTGVLGGAYGAIYLYTRRLLRRLGKERVAANGARYKAASEAFGAIKDVKLLGKEDVLVAQFTGPSRRFNNCQATAALIGNLPRHLFDVLAFGGILVIAIFLILRGEALEDAIPVLGLYAFAGYRLMPALQQIFSSYTRLKFGAAAVENVHRELTQAAPGRRARTATGRRANGSRSATLPLTERLELEGVTFTYPGAHRPALRDVTLTIEAKTTVGIVGPTGSGKTTLVDVILGLLRAQAGVVRVDGVALTDANLRAWQNGLGYVPQHIYLSDDSITRNIAFGIPDAEIDHDAVERAARVANIHGFIAQELPEGYATVVGERGIRLSGGQRQRLGIARAVYHRPSVLVLDEATSALDYDTEAAVMEAIRHLAGETTIIMITHRLAIATRSCDALYQVEDGVVRPHLLSHARLADQFCVSPTVHLGGLRYGS